MPRPRQGRPYVPKWNTVRYPPRTLVISRLLDEPQPLDPQWLDLRFKQAGVDKSKILDKQVTNIGRNLHKELDKLQSGRLSYGRAEILFIDPGAANDAKNKLDGMFGPDCRKGPDKVNELSITFGIWGWKRRYKPDVVQNNPLPASKGDEAPPVEPTRTKQQTQDSEQPLRKNMAPFPPAVPSLDLLFPNRTKNKAQTASTDAAAAQEAGSYTTPVTETRGFKSPRPSGGGNITSTAPVTEVEKPKLPRSPRAATTTAATVATTEGPPANAPTAPKAIRESRMIWEAGRGGRGGKRGGSRGDTAIATSNITADASTTAQKSTPRNGARRGGRRKQQQRGGDPAPNEGSAA